MIFLAHGASAGVESMQRHVDGLARRGLAAQAVALPKGKAERAVPVYRAALGELAASGAIIGGHSYGGRVASLLAAEEPVAGLVLLSYPLHAPGRQETWDQRTEHWPRIECPVMLLSGESDPFASMDLLRQAVARLASAELVTYPGVGHGVGPVLDDALDRIAAFVSGSTAAG
ncbi:MAG: alpha/beta hydrolase family protein [Candidatus Limnocylindria bacterium]